MSGDGTKFIASTLLAINLLPGLGGRSVAAAGIIETQGTYGSRFTGKKLAEQQEPATDDDPPQQPAMPQPDPMPRPETLAVPAAGAVDAEIEMALRRRRISEALIEAAQNDFDRVAKLSEGGYSKDLRKTEKTLTKYLARHNPAHPSAIYIDPNKFDTGIALGFTPELATEKILGLKRVKLGEEAVKDIAGDMKTGDGSKFAAKDAFTQNPSAHFDEADSNPQACVLVPTSGYAPVFQIKGLSYKDNIEYINLHEGWHCKNTRFDFTGLAKEEIAKVDPNHLENSVGNDDQMKAISIANKRESLSDVGTAGDMIRKGRGLDIIDTIAANRHASPEDYLHWTGTSLEGLKQKINDMGMDKFRALSDADARKLYEDVVDKNTFTPAIAEVVLTYRETSNDEDRAATRDWKANFGLMESLMHAGAAVHDGADIKTLDDAIAKAGDERTKTGLTALRDQINEIGLERFRTLNDDDAKKIAQALHDSGATTSDIGENAVGYTRLSADDRKTADKDIAAYKDAVPRAIAMMTPYGDPSTDAEKAFAREHPQQPPPLSPGEQKVFIQLAQWNAGQLLQDRAFAKEGKITPATLTRAYGRMQDELRGELKKHPEDPLLRAKVTKLQQSFITDVQTLDYVDVNAQRGVNIFAKEPSLKTALEEKQAAPGTLVPPRRPPRLGA